MTMEPVVKQSLPVLLIGMIDRPRNSLGQVLASPRWKWAVPALLGLLAIGILLAVSSTQLAEQAQRQQALAFSQIQGQLADLPESQQERVRQQMTMMSSPLAVAGTVLFTRVVGLFIGWAIGTAILYFGLVIGGLEIGFGALFSAYSWTSLSFVLRDLFDAGAVAVTGSLRLNPGLSYFVATGDTLTDARNPIWILTSQIDLFVLWHFILVYALIRAARQRSGGLGLTIVYILVYLALRVMPPMLAGLLSFG